MAECNGAMKSAALGVVLVVAGFGCSGTPTQTCNSNALGASNGTDACASGGSQSSGGSVGIGGNTANSGGWPNTGGISTGGLANTGGTPSTGGTAAGGTLNTGSRLNSGGSATGGLPNSGGVATGGLSNTDGTPSSGAMATGGLPVTGGTRATGGTAQTGGTRASGGSATGGASDPYGCGDGVEFRLSSSGTTYSEACDDGNAVSGDGCENNCMLTENPYPSHQTLGYTGTWGGYDDDFGVSLAADRDWLVVGAVPGGGSFVPSPKTSMPTILVYRIDLSDTAGPDYVKVTEIHANAWAASSSSAEPDIAISNGLIAWNKISFADQLGATQTGAMILEWTGSAWQKKFGVPYPSSVNKCPISTTNCNSRWPTDLALNRGRLIISDAVGDVVAPEVAPGASYPGTGRVFIFRVDGTEPVLEASLYDVSTTYFGTKVSTFDDVAAISSKNKVNLYRRTGDTWQLEQVLPCENGGELERDLFVTAASCGISSSPVGAVNVFRHVKAGWKHEQTIVPFDFNPDLGFGRSVAVAGNRIVIGARGYGVSDGAAFAYTYVPNRYPEWQGVQLMHGLPTQRDSSGNITLVGEDVGYAVAAVGRAMIVGQPASRLLSTTSPKIGQVHVYMDCPSSWGCPLDVCTASAQTCDGSIATRCDANGLAYEEGGTNCHATNQVCSGGACVDPVCELGAGRCTGNTPQLCAPDQLSWRPLDTCTASEYCEDGTGFWSIGCHTRTCTPGTAACVREIAGTCAADGRSLAPGGTDCRATGLACNQGTCVAPLFYEGFENGVNASNWTRVNSGTTAPTTVTGGALGTAKALSCVACELTHPFVTRVNPEYVGFWARTAQVRLTAYAKESGFELFGVDLDTIDTNQSITLENGTGFMPAVARWPSVRTTQWSLIEFKNINWTTRLFDFYYNGDLLKAGVAMRDGAGVDSITLRFNNWFDAEQRVDELIVR